MGKTFKDGDRERGAIRVLQTIEDHMREEQGWSARGERFEAKPNGLASALMAEGIRRFLDNGR